MINFRKPSFWIAFGLSAAACTWFSIRYFTTAFPIANLTITMSRSQAMEAAKCKADTLHIGPHNGYVTAALEEDRAVQKYIELAGGGSEAFNAMITGTLYAPYTWQVRIFEENNAHEARFFYKPTGELYGFIEKIAEETPGAALTSAQARTIAERDAQKDWLVHLNEYQLVESSQDKKPNGRIDHKFTYERPGIKVGAEGLYRLTLAVTGDRLTQVHHSVKVPEKFFQWYSQLRAQNELIHQLASVAFLLLYLILGCYVGLLILARERRLQWQGPLRWALILAACQAVVPINELPLAWMQYDTAMAVRTFLFAYVSDIVIDFLKTFVLILLPALAVAEALTRKAFPTHLQFWKLWKSPTNHSTELLGRTVGGYLMVSFDMAILVITYFITRTYFGWRIPSDPLINPNILATYVPWLSAATRSLYAGFWEEFVFRAIPLAGAALLGERFGKRKLFIGIGLLLQAIIFGGAHANYPTLPGYARLLELIIPSLIFGGLYLRFGLLVPITAHVIYDLVLMGLPIFLSQASGVWMGQLCLVVWALIPLLLVLYFRFRDGGLVDAPESSYNSAAQQEAPLSTIMPALPTITWTPSKRWLLMGACGLLAAGWLISFRWKADAPAVGQLTAAEQIAHTALPLPAGWTSLHKVHAEVDGGDRFVWQTAGPAGYAELMNKHFITPPVQLIRYARFEGELQDRAEEYRFSVAQTGSLLRTQHRLPEARDGGSLSLEQARAKALAAVGEKDVQEISAVSQKKPNRIDWHFVFEVPRPSFWTSNNRWVGHLRIGVVVSGTEVTDVWRFVHVPEGWQRTDKNTQTLYEAVAELGQALLFILTLALALYALATMQLSAAVFWRVFGLLVVIGILLMLNKIPLYAYGLNTSQPLTSQWVTKISGLLWTIIRDAGIAAIIFSYAAGRGVHACNFDFPLLVAVMLGLVIATISPFLRFMGLSPQPWWPHFDGADTLYPGIGVALFMVQQLFIGSARIFAALSGAQLLSRWHPALSILVLTVFSFAIGGMPTSLLMWGIAGTFISVAVIVSYYLGLGACACVPVSTATYLILVGIQQAYLNAFPGAMLGYVLGITLCVILLIRAKKLFS